jgi:predicted NUDIX family phosphoesterase
MVQQEQVLVVERRVFEEAGAFQGVHLGVEGYLDRFFAPGVPRFMPRGEAEHDPSFKQIIPYVIVGADGRFLTYVRGKRAGETRLVGHRSIGIGGHINPADELPLLDADFHQVYLTAVQREVAEEIDIDTGHADRIGGLINDDSTEVGQVHLGVIHHWNLDMPSVRKREQMITQLAFMSPEELHAVRDEMETWSQLCLDHLEDLTASPAGSPTGRRDSDGPS